MSRPRRAVPPQAEAASALGAFVRAHRSTVEEWTISDTHIPGRGSRDCGACGQPWPCPALLGVASRWAGAPGWREEWRFT